MNCKNETVMLLDDVAFVPIKKDSTPASSIWVHSKKKMEKGGTFSILVQTKL